MHQGARAVDRIDDHPQWASGRIVARAVRAAFVEPFDLPTRQVTMSISGGIVMAPEDAESFPKLMQNAKLAVRLVRSEAQSGHHGLGMGDSAPLPAHSHAG